MAKAPRPGDVKTRLRPVLSDLDCAELSKCFLLDAVAKANQMSATVIVAFTPADAGDQIDELLSARFTYIAQRGDDLGARLESAISDAQSQEFGPIVVIGTDSPTVPANYLGLALDYLLAKENGIVIGPSEDGGYYLIGVSSYHEQLFRRISWSTDRVFEQTIANAKRIPGMSISELPSWYDIDEPDDLFRLSAEMENDERARANAPATLRWLAANTPGWTTQCNASAMRASLHQRARNRDDKLF